MIKKEFFELQRIESEQDVKTYIDRLNYALQSGNTRLYFQRKRVIDERRNPTYTNRYTIAALFPDEDEIEVLKRELTHLHAQDYVATVRDTRFHQKSEWRVFGKQYSGKYLYIKIRVELLGTIGETEVFVMSFHFAEEEFEESDFPYKKKGEI